MPSRLPPSGTHTVPPDLSGRPLDAVVRALFEVSWGEARRWIATGKITVDGEPLPEPTRRVRAGAVVALEMNAPRRGKGPALGDEAMVHLDAHVVVVDKPSGVSTVPFDEGETGTLDELVRTLLSKRSRRGDRRERPPLGVVHRLDKETSGLLVFTRTWLAKEGLASQFRAHTVHRRYVALVHGSFERPRTFRTRITADRGDGLRGSLKSPKGEEGQLAITHVEPLEPLQGATLVACRLETGRTHQIRVHLSEAGHPLLGERVYIRGFAGDPIAAPRVMLHAAELGFSHPATSQHVHFERSPPADFEQTLTRLRVAPP